MPLQNRVDPFGNLIATPARGTLFGNRGGRFHRDDRTLGARRHVSRQWICCVLDFKNRQRDVWGRYYTELFFLDEVTALAGGHRPCFECRRAEAQAFAAAFAAGNAMASIPRAPAMDDILHPQRPGLTTRDRAGRLPDGVVILQAGEPFALRGGHALRWTPQGYERAVPRPRGVVDVLTPPAIVAALGAGFVPRWHPSAD